MRLSPAERGVLVGLGAGLIALGVGGGLFFAAGFGLLLGVMASTFD